MFKCTDRWNEQAAWISKPRGGSRKWRFGSISTDLAGLACRSTICLHPKDADLRLGCRARPRCPAPNRRGIIRVQLEKRRHSLHAPTIAWRRSCSTASARCVIGVWITRMICSPSIVRFTISSSTKAQTTKLLCSQDCASGLSDGHSGARRGFLYQAHHRSIANTVIYTAVADKRIRNIWGK
jgi:hypothetical protein